MAAVAEVGFASLQSTTDEAYTLLFSDAFAQVEELLGPRVSEHPRHEIILGLNEGIQALVTGKKKTRVVADKQLDKGYKAALRLSMNSKDLLTTYVDGVLPRLHGQERGALSDDVVQAVTFNARLDALVAVAEAKIISGVLDVALGSKLSGGMSLKKSFNTLHDLTKEIASAPHQVDPFIAAGAALYSNLFAFLLARLPSDLKCKICGKLPLTARDDPDLSPAKLLDTENVGRACITAVVLLVCELFFPRPFTEGMPKALETADFVLQSVRGRLTKPSVLFSLMELRSSHIRGEEDAEVAHLSVVMRQIQDWRTPAVMFMWQEGNVFLSLLRFEEAQAAYRRGIEASGEKPFAFMGMAVLGEAACCAALGRVEKANALLTELPKMTGKLRHGAVAKSIAGRVLSAACVELLPYELLYLMGEFDMMPPTRRDLVAARLAEIAQASVIKDAARAKLDLLSAALDLRGTDPHQQSAALAKLEDLSAMACGDDKQVPPLALYECARAAYLKGNMSSARTLAVQAASAKGYDWHTSLQWQADRAATAL